MQIASSALRTCRADSSAVEYTATECRPMSRQARTIRSASSPRLAISTFCIGPLAQDGDFLARFHEIVVLDQESIEHAGLIRLDLVEVLHDLHQPDDVSLVDLVALGYVGVGIRVGLSVEGAG